MGYISCDRQEGARELIEGASSLEALVTREDLKQSTVVSHKDTSKDDKYWAEISQPILLMGHGHRSRNFQPTPFPFVRKYFLYFTGCTNSNSACMWIMKEFSF